VDRLGHVKCVKFNTNFLTVYEYLKINNQSYASHLEAMERDEWHRSYYRHEL